MVRVDVPVACRHASRPRRASPRGREPRRVPRPSFRGGDDPRRGSAACPRGSGPPSGRHLARRQRARGLRRADEPTSRRRAGPVATLTGCAAGRAHPTRLGHTRGRRVRRHVRPGGLQRLLAAGRRPVVALLRRLHGHRCPGDTPDTGCLCPGEPFSRRTQPEGRPRPVLGRRARRRRRDQRHLPRRAGRSPDPTRGRTPDRRKLCSPGRLRDSLVVPGRGQLRPVRRAPGTRGGRTPVHHPLRGCVATLGPPRLGLNRAAAVCNGGGGAGRPRHRDGNAGRPRSRCSCLPTTARRSRLRRRARAWRCGRGTTGRG